MSLKDMKAELRELRKAHPEYAPVSRLKKADVSAQLERLKVSRETTPPVASTEGAPAKKSKMAVETIKEAKAKEFPMKPAPKETKIVKGGEAPKAESKKKSSKLAKLMKMVEAMSSDEE